MMRLASLAFTAVLLSAPNAILYAADGNETLAGNLVLVEDGVSRAPIIVFQNAPPRTREAADQLAEYVEKISGARPDVIEGQPPIIPPHAIWVGYQPVLKRLMPGVDFDFKHPEEILITADENHLVIAGRDRWDPEHMDGWGRLAPITGRQQEYGTINAVYTFLQDYLHVRWLWPGETGEDVFPRKTIALAPFSHRYHPQFRSRSCLLRRLALGYSKDGPQQQWARYQRLQLDSLELDGGHGFGDWWEKYHEEHPDYFALQPDGTRSGFPNPRNAKLCDSNPAVWDRWLAEVEETLAANPTQQVFNASPNDGWASGHCWCKNCRGWDHPQGELVSYHWKDIREDHPAITDRHVTFANNLARKLKERFPDKELFVQLHAYGLSRPAPVAAVPDDNVIISSVANFHMRGDGVGDERTKSMRQFGDWAAKAPHLAWRPNLGNPAGTKWGMPDVAVKQAAEDFRFVAYNNCIGLYFDMLWNHWATQGPHYYLIAQLAWNPRIDAEAVMEEYYRRGFGPAAGPIEAYWTLMEKTRQDFVDEYHNRLRAFDVPQQYTPQLLDEAESLLRQAADKLAGEPEIYRRRVEFVEEGLRYTRLVVDTRRWMQKVEQTKGADTEAAAHVLANWETAAQMGERQPPFAINYQPVFNQPMSKWMLGLHPDNPLSGLRLREFQTRTIE